MTWLPIGVYRTTPLPILPAPPVPPRTLYKPKILPPKNVPVKIDVVPKPTMQ